MTEPLSSGRRLLVCLGPGGVGKTTVSAALAVHAALATRAVDVMTVDPAPRLLDALGLDASASEPAEVELDGLRERSRGRLRALKLDPKRTFDGLIARYAPSAAAHDTILGNRLYQGLSQALAGLGDYMAIEKLLQLHSAGDADLIVLDTPPASQALDFLDAPRRLLELLGSRAATLLGASRGFLRGQLTMLDLAARMVLAAFDRLTGLRLLADVQSFVTSFDGMYQGFADRAARARELLRAPETMMVVVTTAEARRVEEIRDFIAALGAADLRVGALVVNRVLPGLPRQPARMAGVPVGLRRKLARNLRDFTALLARETASISELRGLLPAGTPIFIAPDLGHEPVAIADLAAIGTAIYPAAQVPRPPRRSGMKERWPRSRPSHR